MMVQSLSVRYGKRTVFEQYSQEFRDNAVTAILGPSGCGKTTLLFSIADTLGKRGERISFVFQEPRLIRTKTVEKNIMLALKGISDREAGKKAAENALELTGLTQFRKAYPFQLSGGMAQRVSLGRALCRNPELLLMDEPFGSLDAITRKKLQEELHSICAGNRITVIFVTHDVNEAIMLSSRILVMNRGQITDDIDVDLPQERNENDSGFAGIKKYLYKSINS